jgi:hypothetical protein
MVEQWTPGAKHPNNPNFVALEIPGGWVDTEPYVEPTPEQLKPLVDQMVDAMGTSDFMKGWLYGVYNIKPDTEDLQP